MKCAKCGAELQDNAEFCHDCGATIQPDTQSEKVIARNKNLNTLTIVFFIMLAVILLTLVMVVLKLNDKTDNSQSTDSSQVTQEVITPSPQPVQETAIIAPEPAENVSIYRRTEVSDVEAAVKEVRRVYNMIQSNLDSYAIDESTPGMKIYTDSQQRGVRIDIYPNHASEYTRYYYFDNEKLCFAFVFDGKKENRLYFTDDFLFRWIDENGVIHDNEIENSNFLAWEEFVRADLKY